MSTESDRELLELAAKAADIQIIRSRLHDPLWRDLLIENSNVEQDGNPSSRWNPLTDDGDALRLAVKLEFDVTRYSGYEVAVTARSPTHGTPGIYLTERQSLDSDPYAATRRAIVRAAAAIARATHKEGA